MTTKALDWRPGTAVCRCCFTEGCYKDISTEYFWMGKREVYEEILLETFNVNISYAQTSGPNSNSRLICEQCISRLRDAADFKKQVVDCEKVFQHHLSHPEDTVEEQSEAESLGKEEIDLEIVKKESKADAEDDDDFDGGFPEDDGDDVDDQPLTTFASKKPKKETLDLIEILESAKTEKRKSSTKLIVTPAKKVKTVKEPEPSASASKAKPAPIDKQKKDWWKAASAKRNALLVLTYSTAYPLSVRRNVTSIFCRYCDQPFEDPKLFRLHVDCVHQKADRTAAVIKNNLLGIDIINLKCNLCSDSSIFASLETLVEHLNQFHTAHIDTSLGYGAVPLRLEKDRYQCVVCQKVLHGTSVCTLGYLVRHTASHYYKIKCPICSKQFRDEAALKKHSDACPNSRVFCKTCKTSFATVKEKKKHFLKSNKCWSYSCSECTLRFASWDQRAAHLSDAHGHAKVAHTCKKCKDVFETRNQLYRHYKVEHTEDFKCQFCGRTFYLKTSLDVHTSSHLNEKPHQCHVCGKDFTLEKSLKNHMNLHDNSKMVACPVCGKLYVCNNTWRRHMRSRHPECSITF